MISRRVRLRHFNVLRFDVGRAERVLRAENQIRPDACAGDAPAGPGRCGAGPIFRGNSPYLRDALWGSEGEKCDCGGCGLKLRTRNVLAARAAVSRRGAQLVQFTGSPNPSDERSESVVRHGTGSATAPSGPEVDRLRACQDGPGLTCFPVDCLLYVLPPADRSLDMKREILL